MHVITESRVVLVLKEAVEVAISDMVADELAVAAPHTACQLELVRVVVALLTHCTRLTGIMNVEADGTSVLETR